MSAFKTFLREMVVLSIEEVFDRLPVVEDVAKEALMRLAQYRKVCEPKKAEPPVVRTSAPSKPVIKKDRRLLN